MTTTTPLTSYSTASNAVASVAWLSNNNRSTWIAFDLGSVQTLAGFHLWNYNEVNLPGRSIKNATVYPLTSLPPAGSSYSGSVLNYVNAAGGSQSFHLHRSAGTSGYAGEEYSFTTPMTTQYVLIYVNVNDAAGITGNYYGSTNAYTGIAEILFRGKSSQHPAVEFRNRSLQQRRNLRRRRQGDQRQHRHHHGQPNELRRHVSVGRRRQHRQHLRHGSRAHLCRRQRNRQLRRLAPGRRRCV